MRKHRENKAGLRLVPDVRLYINEEQRSAINFILGADLGELLYFINLKSNEDEERKFRYSRRAMAFYLQSSVNTISKNLDELQLIGLISPNCDSYLSGELRIWIPERFSIKLLVDMSYSIYKESETNRNQEWLNKQIEKIRGRLIALK
jgi:hypothetical protein